MVCFSSELLALCISFLSITTRLLFLNKHIACLTYSLLGVLRAWRIACLGYCVFEVFRVWRFPCLAYCVFGVFRVWCFPCMFRSTLHQAI